MVSYVSRSITCMSAPETETTWPCLRLMMGTHTFASTGWGKLRFWPSNTPWPSTRAFALPCLPGFEVL